MCSWSDTICVATIILCPCLFCSLPYNMLVLFVWLVMFRMNTGSLDLRPGTLAKGQTGPWKVTLLPGHCVLEANMGSLSKQVVSGQLRATNTKECVCMRMCVRMCLCTCQVKVWMGSKRAVSAGDECLCYTLG